MNNGKTCYLHYGYTKKLRKLERTDISLAKIIFSYKLAIQYLDIGVS